MPGMRRAGLTGAAVGAGVAGAGVRRAELAMELPLSRDRSYQGMVFRMPKRTSTAAASASRTAQESRETRRSGDDLDICGYSYGDCLNGMRGLNFCEERKLATTTGGEPAHSDARDGRSGIVHKADFTIAPKTMQGGPPQLHHRLRALLIRRNRPIPREVKLRPTLQPLVGALLRLDLARHLSRVPVVVFLSLPPGPFPIEVTLQSSSLVVVGAIRDISFQLFLVIALIDCLRGDRRTAVIEEGAKTSSIQLKLDAIVLHHDPSHPGRVSFANRDAISLQPFGIFFPVHRVVFVEAQIHPLLGPGHVDLYHDFLAHEALQRVRILSAQHQRPKRDGKDNS